MLLKHLILLASALSAVNALVPYPAPVSQEGSRSTLLLRDNLKVTNVTRSVAPFDQDNITTDLAVRSEQAATVLSTLITSSFNLALRTCVVAAIATAGVACYTALAAVGIATIFSLLKITGNKYVGEALKARVVSSTYGSNGKDHWRVHEDFSGTESCDTYCTLKAHTPEAKWTHFANVTARDVPHKASFWQSGSMRALSIEQTTDSASTSSSVNKREDDVYLLTSFAKKNNIIASISWVEDDQTTWDEWDSSDNEWVAEDYGAYIVNQNAELSCLDVNDGGGPVFQSAWVVADDDDIWELAHDDISSVLSTCYDMDSVSS